MTNISMQSTRTTTTAGSIPEQLINAHVSIYARRFARDGGAEAAAPGSTTIRTWSLDEPAAFRLLRESFLRQLNPGTEVEVERACKEISRAAFLGWEDMRDGVVNPLVEPTRRNIGALCARGIAKLRVQNASSFIDDIFHKITDHVDLFAKQIRGAVEPLCGPEERLRSIDRAVMDRGEGLATTIAALERLRSRALAEPERIDRALREATANLDHEWERLRVVAIESDHSILWKDRRLARFVAEASANVPKLGENRIFSNFAPIVRAGQPTLVRALDDRIEHLNQRRHAVLAAFNRLNEIAAGKETSAAESTRVQVVGTPKSSAAMDAEMERVANAARDAVERELRNISVYKTARSAILETALSMALAAVSKFTVPRSLDDVLLAEMDPASLALQLDALIQGAAIPLALSNNADRAFLFETRCMVLRVGAGSRLPSILSEHAGYRADSFAFDGSPDRLEVLVFQPGIDINQTTLFLAGRGAYEAELADKSAPPLHVLSDSFLACLTGKPKSKTSRVEDGPDGAKVM